MQARGPVTVTVGIPTYNRSETLAGAVASVFEQDYSHLEIVICDNASTDRTGYVCRELAKHDARLRYIRQQHNVGLLENFRAVLRLASGEYFMWLADDDRLDRNYISACLSAFRRDPTLSLVSGVVLYEFNGRVVNRGVTMRLLDDSATRRVRDFWRLVDDNGVFYGLMPRRVFASGTVEGSLGADWLWVARAAFLGKVSMIDETALHRRSSDRNEQSAIVAAERLPSWSGHFQFVQLGLKWLEALILGAPPYSELGVAQRLSLAGFCVPKLMRRQMWYEILRGLNTPFGRPLKPPIRVAHRWAHRYTGGRFVVRFPGYSTRRTR